MNRVITKYDTCCEGNYVEWLAMIREGLSEVKTLELNGKNVLEQLRAKTSRGKNDVFEEAKGHPCTCPEPYFKHLKRNKNSKKRNLYKFLLKTQSSSYHLP